MIIFLLIILQPRNFTVRNKSTGELVPVRTILKRKINRRTGQTFLAIHMTPIGEDNEAMMTIDDEGILSPIT